MKICHEHPGALVIHDAAIDDKCPVCQQFAFYRDFEVKLNEVEQDIRDMKAKNNREMGLMTAELMAYAARDRI